MSPRSARAIRDILELPKPELMSPLDRRAYRSVKRRYNRQPSIMKARFLNNVRVLSKTIIPT